MPPSLPAGPYHLTGPLGKADTGARSREGSKARKEWGEGTGRSSPDTRHRLKESKQLRKQETSWEAGEAPVMVSPLPAPLLLKSDISEAAGAPEEVERKWQPVGSQPRRVTDRKHRGQEGELG